MDFPSYSVIPKPSISSPAALLDNSLKSKTVNGMTISRPKYTRQLHKWTLSWSAISATALNLIFSCYQANAGGSQVFRWLDLDSNTYKNVRFNSDIQYIEISNSNGEKIYKVSFDLMEA